MIAVSEPPLEYIPRGRPAVDEHPGPTEAKQQPHFPSENILLQRLQNVNISAKEEHNEFWCIREIYEECNKRPKTSDTRLVNGRTKLTSELGSKLNKNEFNATKQQTDKQAKYSENYGTQEYMSEYLVNSEEELYVKKYTAVWTRGD